MPESTKEQALQRMSVDEAVLRLGKKDAWRLNELPAGIANERMLRELGVKGYLDARMWTWFNPNPTKYRVENPKPLQEQSWGSWRSLLKIRDWTRVMGLGDDRQYPPGEIRLNDVGMSRFAGLQDGETAVPADGHAATSQSAKKTKENRGRKKTYDSKKDAQWVAAWDSGAHRFKSDCALALDTTVKELKKAIDRHRKKNSLE